MDSRPSPICCGTDRSHPRRTPVSDDPDFRLRLSTNPCNRIEHLNSNSLCTWHCPTCRDLDSDMMGLKDHLWPKHNARILRHCQQEHGYEVTKTHTGNGTYKGAFAFTLTKSRSDVLSVNDMIAAAKKILNQKSNPTKRFAWYLEFKEDDTHPHIHGMYETESGGRIESKHFKRAWPIWDPTQKMGAGFRGGYHRPVRHDEAYDNYIAKDGGPSGQFNLSL